ncbi:39S ribosomal protein L48, mitochondrial [Lampris incognitus]|uniref:39S ribosomal protein L48, mitochondrial n=1 Tax=Lampris incognitus TaxID=2546036 RepID=UPI0024B565F6|nr:39S ribosomal protein L48, mitochondrial [Lampris incognitus]
MNSAIGKLQISLAQQLVVLNRAAAFLRRTTASIQLPVSGGIGSVNGRQYRAMPTHGIGRWRHLSLKEAPKKKKDRHQMKQIMPATDTEYATLNVQVSGYDMVVVEHYSQYIHNLSNRLGIKVGDSYALPTKSTEIMLMQEQGTKLYVEGVLKTHERVVQLNNLNTTLCPIFIDILLQNQPEGVQLSVKEHTEVDYHARFKARPELEGLLVQMGHKD